MPRPQRFLPAGRDNHVQMIALDRILTDAEIAALGYVEQARLELANETAIAK